MDESLQIWYLMKENRKKDFTPSIWALNILGGGLTQKKSWTDNLPTYAERL